MLQCYAILEGFICWRGVIGGKVEVTLKGPDCCASFFFLADCLSYLVVGFRILILSSGMCATLPAAHLV